ncbi:MAG: dTDP-4-dehydrorhamnose 3,5-epimerase family protein [Candidatus Omnitrophica bacterium]|nr:dTDP-4-dehydrorhamnose 3,5-epimerase family protein [Candidatus Omnitrophota bacterium]
MIIESTILSDVWRIKPDVNKDFRGDYLMIHHEEYYDKQFYNTITNDSPRVKLPPNLHWVEWDIATSRKGTFRGIHYSPNCWKIYQCLAGVIYYIFVNCDKSDKEYGKWASFHLEPYDQLLKHPKYGAGMLALEDNTMLHYAQSQYYDANNPDQKTFTLKDFPDIFIPNIPLILSERDTKGYYIKS